MLKQAIDKIYNYYKYAFMKNNFLILEFEKIRKQHDIKVVSFDCFDTILTRKVKNPNDLFYIIEKLLIKRNIHIPFHKIRVLAQELALQENNKKEVTFEQIYHQLYQLLIGEYKDNTKEILQIIQELEISTELRYLTPKKKTIEFLNYLHSQYPEIKKYIISDMYLSKEYIEKFINYYDISSQWFEDIWVSSDKQKNKASGDLIKEWFAFNCINKIKNKECLHIGDHPISDNKNFIEISSSLGQKTNVLRTPSFKEMIFKIRNTSHDEKDLYQIFYKNFAIFHDQNMPSNIMTGFLLNKQFNHEQTKNDTFFNLFLFPFVLGFCQNLLQDVKNKNIKKIYFLARDGYLLKKSFDIYLSYIGLQDVETYYLLASRKISYAAQIDSLNAINFLNNPYSKIKIKELLNNRLGIKVEESQYKSQYLDFLDQYNLDFNSIVNQTQHQFILQNFFIQMKKNLTEELTEDAKNYQEYLKEMSFFEATNTAIVDIGYSGSIQDLLNMLYKKKNPNQNIHGFYLMTFQDIQDKIYLLNHEHQGYIGSYVDKYNSEQKTIRKIPLWESIFSSPEETFLKIEKKEEKLIPVFKSNLLEKEEREKFFFQMEHRLFENLTSWCRLNQEVLSEISIDKDVVTKNMNDFLSTKHIHGLFEGIYFEDNFTSGQRDSIQRGYQHVEIFWYHDIIMKCMSLFLSSSKKSKLFKSPAKFFIDSQSHFIRKLGEIVFRIE